MSLTTPPNTFENDFGSEGKTNINKLEYGFSFDDRESLRLRLQIVPETFQPLNIRFLSKPGNLPLGILAGFKLCGVQGLF
jgi:hypothetical protein